MEYKDRREDPQFILLSDRFPLDVGKANAIEDHIPVRHHHPNARDKIRLTAVLQRPQPRVELPSQAML